MLEFVTRKNTRSLKYDALEERFGRHDLLPFWLADMDCRAPQAVRQALAQRLEHGIYGYSSGEQEQASRAAVLHWLQTKHKVCDLNPDDCRIYAGVLEALAVCIEVFCPRSEAIIVQSPAYNGFYPILQKSGRTVIENTLVQNAAGEFVMDLAMLEQQLQSSPVRPRLFLLCSPHNPTGRVWRRDELLELLAICQKYDLYLVSDEIHFDFVYPQNTHLSLLRQEFCQQHDKIMLLSAPSKTFNIPALRSAYLLSRNADIMQRSQHFCEQFQIGEISLLGHLALEACYQEKGAEQWLAELLLHLQQNRDRLHDFLQQECPQLGCPVPEGTTLYWINCCKFLSGEPEALRHFFVEAGLALGWGDWYRGNGWVRFNFACDKTLLEQGLELWQKQWQKVQKTSA